MEHSRSDWLKAYLHGKGTAPVHTLLGLSLSCSPDQEARELHHTQHRVLDRAQTCCSIRGRSPDMPIKQHPVDP